MYIEFFFWVGFVAFVSQAETPNGPRMAGTVPSKRNLPPTKPGPRPVSEWLGAPMGTSKAGWFMMEDRLEVDDFEVAPKPLETSVVVL